MKKKITNGFTVFMVLIVGAVGFGSSKLLVEFFGYNKIRANDFIQLQNEIKKLCLEINQK